MPFHFIAAEYPESPGCYLMKNAAGGILYIGKSKNLRNRLRSYFTKQHEHKRIKQLVGEIAAIEVVLVNNEAESLLLENNLIKRHKPPYNRALMKEESGYAYLQFTKEKLPRLEVYYRNSGRRRRESDLEDDYAYDQFLITQYGREKADRPGELIVNTIGDLPKVRSALNRRGVPKIRISLPKRGVKYELLQLCKSNYEYRTRKN